MQEDGGLIVRKWSAMPLRARSDGVWRGALRRRARATDAPAKVQRCTRQLQSFALPHGATFALTPSATFALRGAQPLHCWERNLCTAASATFALPPVLPLRFRERIYAGWRRHRGFPDASYGPAEEWRSHAKCRRESHPEESPRLFRPSEDLFSPDFIGSGGYLG